MRVRAYGYDILYGIDSCLDTMKKGSTQNVCVFKNWTLFRVFLNFLSYVIIQSVTHFENIYSLHFKFLEVGLILVLVLSYNETQLGSCLGLNIWRYSHLPFTDMPHADPP